MQAHNSYTSVYKAIEKETHKYCAYTYKCDISIHMSHVQESERAVQYVITKEAICRGIATTCATKARCRLMIPICSPNLWPPMESLGGAVLCSFGVEKTAPNKSFRACTCTKLHNNHEGNLHHIPRKY